MKQDPSKITFSGENGRDDFKREKVAEKLITLITSDINISPMIIDGDWGTGKSEFCFKLINKFKENHQDYKLVYVDAFQADHADNPLVTILSAVMSVLEESGQKRNLLEKSLPVARMVLSTLTKAVVSHALKQDLDILSEQAADSLNDSAKSAIDSTIRALITDHEKAKDNIRALQKALTEIASSSPIVIFIDELDRCRPDFAVQMLETIKHTFEAENVSFVLITNTSQLKAAIKHRYGSEVNAQRYLDKFIKFSFKLPTFVATPESRYYESLYASSKYFSELIKQSELLKRTILSQEEEEPSFLARELIRRNNLSLREVELFVRNLEIYQALNKNIPTTSDVIGGSIIIIISAWLSCFAIEVAEKIQNEGINYSTMLNLLTGQDKIDDNLSPHQMSTSEKIGHLMAQDCMKDKLSVIPNAKFSSEWETVRFSYFNNRYKKPMNEVKKILQKLMLAPT